MTAAVDRANEAPTTTAPRIAAKLDVGKLFTHLALHKEETLNWIMHGKLTQPTRLVWGYNDPTAELKRGHALFEIIADSNPKSEMHIINEAGHFCYREQPETFNGIVKTFVEKSAKV